jgi:hypothetical protein
MIHLRISRFIFLVALIVAINSISLQSISLAQVARSKDDKPDAFDKPNFDDPRGRLRQKMEKAALEDEHTFIGKLSRQIELEKNKYVINVKNAQSQSEADAEVDRAKSEMRSFLEICKDLRVVGRYYVLDIARVPNPESADREYLVDCRIDEPEIDWEETGKKTRNCTRRVEHSYFYVGGALADKIKKNDVILVQGQIEVLDIEESNNDQLPYLMVVSLNYDVLSGRLSEAGAKNNRFAKLLIESYQVTLESDEEKRLKTLAKQKASTWKKQFVANAFAEKVEELFKARNDKLVNAQTSTQRDDVIKSSNRAFNKYLATCNSLTFSAVLVIEDVVKDGSGHMAMCTIASDQPDDDISFAETDFLSIRSYQFPVDVKDTVGRVAKPKDSLIVTGIIEFSAVDSNDYSIDYPLLGNKRKLPLFKAGKNHVFLVLKDVSFESSKD